MTKVKTAALAIFGAYAVLSALPSTATPVQASSVKVAQVIQGGVVPNAYACKFRR